VPSGRVGSGEVCSLRGSSFAIRSHFMLPRFPASPLTAAPPASPTYSAYPRVRRPAVSKG
jgi:hypothetical protein